MDVHAWGVNVQPEPFVDALYKFRWLFLAEGVILLWDILFGTIGIRKKLRPLNEMCIRDSTYPVSFVSVFVIVVVWAAFRNAFFPKSVNARILSVNDCACPGPDLVQ